MKIAFDAKRAFRNHSGLGNYSRNVISLLAKNFPENEYLLFTPKTGIEDQGFPPEKSRIITPDGFLERRFRSFWRTWRLSHDVKKLSPDIYHGLSHELPWNIASAGTRSVVTMHDLIFVRYPNLYKAIDRKIYLEKWKYAARKADLIMAISQQTKRDVCDFLDVDDSKVKVIYQACHPSFREKMGGQDLDSIRKKYSLPSEYLLYVGTIEPRKNLLEVLKSLFYGKVDTPLIIIGKEKKPYAENVRYFIEKKQMKQVRYLSDVPNKDLPAIYQLSKLFLYPSSFEGFGLPVLEAISSGVPVIAAKGSCLEETGGPSSMYIDPFDTDLFAEKIQRVLSDNDLRMSMIVKGLEFSSKFSPEKFAREIHQTYESLL